MNFKTLSLVAAVAAATLSSQAQAPLRLEAESATLTGTAVTASRAGFSGTGYVSGMDRKTDKITFAVNLPAGLYDLALRYSSPFGNKGYVLELGGLRMSGMFQPTGDAFATHRAGVVDLPGGVTTLAIEYGWGFYDIDYIELAPAARPAPPQKPPAVPCDPAATPRTRELMALLVRHYGAATLAGAQSAAEFDHVRQLTGTPPAILGDDLMEYSPSRIERGAKTKNLVESMIARHREGAILTVMWHWNAPAGLEKSTTNTQGRVSTEKWWSGFYTRATTFDVEAALADPKSEAHALLLRDLDAIASELRKFADADVPVLWRPLHEAEGGWFWWGAKGPKPFVQLWRLMYDRYTRHHKLHNLIWVFTGSANADWYPGDDVVDVIGLDSYPDDRRDPLTGDWQGLQQRFNGRKLLALTEFGGVPDIERMQRLGVWWSYFLPWTGTKGTRGAPPEDVKRIYTLPAVLARPTAGQTPK